MGMKRKKVRGVTTANAEECLAATSTALTATTKYTTSPRARLRISVPHTSCFASSNGDAEDEDRELCTQHAAELHARSHWTALDNRLADSFVNYISFLIQPHRSVFLASKHSRFINHPISTYLINTNLNEIVNALMSALSGIVSLDVSPSQSISPIVSRLLHGSTSTDVDQHDHHGYLNASHLLTRLRRLSSSPSLIEAIGMYMMNEDIPAIQFAYVTHRHLIPIATLANTQQAIDQVCSIVHSMVLRISQNTRQPVWETETDRPLVHSHIPQLHSIDWASIAVDALIQHFVRTLHAHSLGDDPQRRFGSNRPATDACGHTCNMIDRSWCIRRQSMLETCLALMITPFGIHTQRYPITITDFINHRQSTLSNTANHALTFMQILVPNLMSVLPELWDETYGWRTSKMWGCSGGTSLLSLDTCHIRSPASVTITCMAHAHFVMHMANDVHAVMRPPLTHRVLDDAARLIVYMPHVVACLHNRIDALTLKSCQLTYVLILHVPPCTWTARHMDTHRGRWIGPMLVALGHGILHASDMNLLKVIVPQMHDILTRLTYDGLVRAVQVLMAWQSSVAIHLRTDTFVSCAFEHIAKRVTLGMAPTLRAIISNPSSTPRERLFVEYSARQLCELIKLQCRLPYPFDANLLFHSKEQHKSTLELLAELHNEAHGIGQLVSLECAAACDLFVDRLLQTIAEAEATVAEYLSARETFSQEKQIFCDHVVKRVHQLSTVKSYSMLVRKMRQQSTAQPQLL